MTLRNNMITGINFRSDGKISSRFKCSRHGDLYNTRNHTIRGILRNGTFNIYSGGIPIGKDDQILADLGILMRSIDKGLSRNAASRIRENIGLAKETIIKILKDKREEIGWYWSVDVDSAADPEEDERCKTLMNNYDQAIKLVHEIDLMAGLSYLKEKHLAGYVISSMAEYYCRSDTTLSSETSDNELKDLIRRWLCGDPVSERLLKSLKDQSRIACILTAAIPDEASQANIILNRSIGFLERQDVNAALQAVALEPKHVKDWLVDVISQYCGGYFLSGTLTEDKELADHFQRAINGDDSARNSLLFIDEHQIKILIAVIKHIQNKLQVPIHNLQRLKTIIQLRKDIQDFIGAFSYYLGFNKEMTQLLIINLLHH